ncbi:MAG: Ig-like domain-containing protein, partial [Thermoplasmata archaeon]|nr:Ig-like domain-containing protein [Thermoplasmata archaeon]
MKTNLMKGASFLAAMMMVTMGLSTVMAGPQLPFDRLGDTTYNTQLVCSWVDGVEYGNATTSATGYLEISTAGDDTVEDNVQTGADATNVIQYSVGRLTGATARFFAVAENDVYTAGGSFTSDLTADAADTVLLKIDIVASQATAGVTDYVVIYNPHTAAVDATTYSLAVGTAAAQPIIAGDIVAGLATNNVNPIPAGGSLAINMVKWGGLSNTGNSVKLLLATRVVDRVEYGSIATAPENTLMSNAQNPTSGNEIYRNAHADTNMCLADFASRAQTIIPDITAPTITTIVPADGATGVALNAAVTVTWSEAMSTAGMSVTIDPAPLVAGTWAWSVGNTVYTYTG